jgi:hypothetical protein
VFKFARRVVAAVQISFFCAACGSISQDKSEPSAGNAGTGPDAGSSSADGGAGSGIGAAGASPNAGSLSAAGGADSGVGAGGASPGSDAGGAGPTSSEAGAAGDSEPVCASRFATAVVSFTAGPGPTTGQSDLPDIVLGPPKGGGTIAGSLDVATLGNGGSITLGFAPSVIVDRPGPDFIVFENPFDVNGDPTKPFAELATVEVSDDGQTFHAFPCTATSYPYGSCAGWHPVLANADTNTIDPTDPAVAGGDAFDLADLGVRQARFVRITDRVDQTGTAGTFDLDAVSIVHAECP